jgi:hypothetical protein
MLSHFRRRFDAEHCEPGRKHGHDPLHQSQARRGQFWIILDNEA